MASSTSRAACIENLESRRLLASVGPVMAQQFVGTPEGVSAVILHFDQPLDPTTAQNPDAYELIKKFRHEGDDGGFFGPSPIFGGGEEASTSNSHVRIESAIYDPANNTVRLIAKNIFTVRQSFTVIVVRGKGPNAVLTPTGEALDGDGNGKPGGDVTLRFKSAVSKRFKFKEKDGDNVTIKLDGDGRFFWLNPVRGRSSPVIFTRFTNTASILSGTIKQGKKGNGIVDIAQISGSEFTNSLTTPPFNVRPTPT
jgi:hypothetical protein